jgi:hypothetical protein
MVVKKGNNYYANLPFFRKLLQLYHDGEKLVIRIANKINGAWVYNFVYQGITD